MLQSRLDFRLLALREGRGVTFVRFVANVRFGQQLEAGELVKIVDVRFGEGEKLWPNFCPFLPSL